MTPAEWGVLIGVIGVPLASALIAIGIAVGKRGSEPAARETALPPPPSTHAGSMLDGDLAAMRGRLTAVEADLVELKADAKEDRAVRTTIMLTLAEAKGEKEARRQLAAGRTHARESSG